ncbi:predicted protein [Streptomyces viridochromogenes DSM 40736]|uniref:Predicted protein n=1 Tax=Streptomyces viridochromogenes (strain DSM 40736 / JCM 4977 / BCRC 1201 / Tue 494) TaxID=591159 RepID=D9XDX6_STRVT|nr:predicted protein [Streptomyces viridochromogenes DSM 40736]
MILYGVDGGRSKEEDPRAAGAEMFTYPGGSGVEKPITGREHRVNPGTGVDASGVTGRNSKGDAPHVS